MEVCGLGGMKVLKFSNIRQSCEAGKEQLRNQKKGIPMSGRPQVIKLQ